jgi:hypothetical protein
MLTLVFAGGEEPPGGAGQEVNQWLDENGQAYARAFSSGSMYWIRWRDLGVFAFSAASLVVRVWPERGSRHEAIIYVFSMLRPVILQALGWQALHAGAAVGPAGALAFCGRSGCGKSTLAFAMQQVGWHQYADDALLLRLDQGCVTACPLPFKPRLRPASRAHFERAALPSCPEPLSAEVPLSAVFLLQQNCAVTVPRVSLIPQWRAFSEVLPHAHCFDVGDPAHTRRLVESYLELVACVPVFKLEYRPDLQRLQQITSAVIQTAASIDSDAIFSSELRAAV